MGDCHGSHPRLSQEMSHPDRYCSGFTHTPITYLALPHTALTEHSRNTHRPLTEHSQSTHKALTDPSRSHHRPLTEHSQSTHKALTDRPKEQTDRPTIRCKRCRALAGQHSIIHSQSTSRCTLPMHMQAKSHESHRLAITNI